MARAPSPPKANLQAIAAGYDLLRADPLFGSLLGITGFDDLPQQPFPADGYARLLLRRLNTRYATRLTDTSKVTLEVNPWQRATPAEWQNVIAQCLLHVAMNHIDPVRSDPAWRAACEIEATVMLRQLSIGQRPGDLALPDEQVGVRRLDHLAETIAADGGRGPDSFGRFGTAGTGQPTWSAEPDVPPFHDAMRAQNQAWFASAVRNAIANAVATAGDAARATRGRPRNPNSLAEKARSWCIAEYPLLAALAAAFDIVEDAEICQRAGIAIAAVNSEERRLYINPHFAWTWPAMQFVMAHELLHVGLRHEARRQGRDPYLWNVACDFVINGWLVEMGVGRLPTDDLLLDPDLGLERDSAEALYDRIVRDLRLRRRLAKQRTLGGVGRGDLLSDRPSGWWTGIGCDLDSFYRRALAEGLDLHLAGPPRGLLPGDLVEEIRALQQPPIPWDVKLGQWLDQYFPPAERRRSYARASRRQSATPDIPRPVWERPPVAVASRTFGVVLDTSGSMSSRLIGRALGAIVSYALSREVPAVRLMQCDAAVHDMGYVDPERLAGTVEIRGRGGTVLQPAIEKLLRAKDFPKDAPILVITDGGTDLLTIPRDHAFLMPDGARLPFRSIAPRFAFDEG
ncbi:DUF2201 family putative metallopeptidase [Prosthecomicrobium hirschii]|uniref:vWA domain-containing protein n=1 Tax=Prosthecodimorpha hirschii TaxID=665126 RepID=UPI00221F7F79|nr:VWA-like domain-containing protein [Prosthecomicrobium hirschii]MCW1841963.1 VWA-like domain-containing protein [Prosthecomicrobium hirschii]